MFFLGFNRFRSNTNYRVQAVSQQSLPVLLKRLPKIWRPGVTSIEEGVNAAARAVNFAARYFGWLDSCLVRSLVTGVLLAGQDNVELVLGFQSGTEGVIEGHAWLEVGGLAVIDRPDSLRAYTESRRFNMSARVDR
ncbi:MAG: lasso peptide biosynthesis B2 protein [gamma proteobacterium symbiont of Bathyaustriella thionipta]|nr:lasso peptide biosynthesis B2 protein [gamma proteobacterium symbiont of Bathyaustriella thionipta]